MKNIKDFFAKNTGNLKEKFKNVDLDKIKAYLPKEKPKINIGLDIGSFFVKAVALKIEKDGVQLLKFAVEQTNKNFINDSIEKILSDFNLESKNVNLSIAGQGVVVRTIEMPKMSISEAKNAAGFEAEKHIPFPLDEVFIDCYILKQIPEENKMLVLVAAARKDLVQQRIDLLRQLRLEPNLIDVDSIALANIYNRLSPKVQSVASDAAAPVKEAALLNIGASFSSICILKDGMPRFVRDIFIGGNDFTKRISNILGLEIIDAEKAKCNPNSDWANIIASCETVLNNLANEVRRSFDFFESDTNSTIGSLYLSGGGSCLKGIDDIFRNYLNIEVKFLDPLAGIKINEGIDIESLKSQSPKLAVAVGAALRLK